ncbi:MAG: hypothetical protein V4690_01995 [Patescibacteria group bacterium]
MKQKFEVYVAGPISEHTSFEEALKSFFTAVMDMVEKGTSFQVLETGCWITGSFEMEDGKVHRAPLYFYDARDFAVREKVLVQNSRDKFMADPLPSIPAQKVYLLFIEAGLTELLSLTRVETEIRGMSHG